MKAFLRRLRLRWHKLQYLVSQYPEDALYWSFMACLFLLQVFIFVVR